MRQSSLSCDGHSDKRERERFSILVDLNYMHYTNESYFMIALKATNIAK